MVAAMIGQLAMRIPSAAILLGILIPASASLAANNSLAAATASITDAELYRHVEVLADDIYEGRAAGSRGGHAAAKYVLDQLRADGLTEPADKGVEVQTFKDRCRNILVLFPGDDPPVETNVIVIGAHYDHVGYGKSSNNLVPQGRIHNGADDNASGTSVLLEMIQAFTTPGLKTRRSILFAFWDSEENGLVGSRHWISHPTLPIDQVKLNITLDMVGRLRDQRLQVLGTRSGYGLRRLFSGPVDEPLWLDFAWELRANSDHWPFLERGIPAAAIHTGLHSDYHRPTDDVEKINAAGMQDVARYLLAVLIKAANEDRLPTFRSTFKRETDQHRRVLEQPLPPASLANWPQGAPRPRLGIAWREDDAEPNSVLLTRVVHGTPAAAADLAVGDRLYELDNEPFANGDALLNAIHARLDAGNPAIAFRIERRGHIQTVTVPVVSTLQAPDSSSQKPRVPADE
jgi:hypothetical protein